MSFIIYPSVSLVVGRQDQENDSGKKNMFGHVDKQPCQRCIVSRILIAFLSFMLSNHPPIIVDTSRPAANCRFFVSKVASQLDSVALGVIKGDVVCLKKG